jgi:hypothetical protein
MAGTERPATSAFAKDQLDSGLPGGKQHVASGTLEERTPQEVADQRRPRYHLVGKRREVWKTRSTSIISPRTL